MHHPDLKSLIWGRHLQGLLRACGVSLKTLEPPPRVVGKIPSWFQRLGALLTVLGLVGAIKMVDRAISPRPAGIVHEAEVAPLDAGDWNRWMTGSWQLREGQLRIGSEEEETDIGEPIVLSLADPDSAAQAPSMSGRTASGGTPGRTTSGDTTEREPGEATLPPNAHRFQRIEVTAYSSRPSETDMTPDLTATKTAPAAGTIALSRDLLRTFTPRAPFDFGDKVLIPGVGIFDVRDTMSPRWKEKADIWFAVPDQARTWGRRTVFVTRIERRAP